MPRLTGQIVDCKTTAEFDAAIKAGHTARVFEGWWTAPADSHVEARESSHVEAWGSSHVEAWGSSHVVARGSSHVVARESSHVVARGSSHVEACGSSHVEAWESSHVEAWGSSHVVARGSAHVVARGSSHVEASRYVTVTQHGTTAIIDGGVLVVIPPITTPAEWCEYYGVTVTDGIATLFKAVRDDYRSGRGFSYLPGTSPEAPDWDGGREECGGGLHFSPHPQMALAFDSSATKFVACPVALTDIAVHHPASYPEKVKARRICGPIVEVDRYGKPMSQPVMA